MNKENLRKKFIDLRENLSQSEIDFLSEKLFKNLTETSLYKNAKSIFIYISVGKEAPTIKIIEDALSKGKIVLVPKVISKEKKMYPVRINSLNDLVPGVFNIPEPREVIIEDFDPDLTIVPGLVFDRSGNRIGYGGGYYDRYLSSIKSSTIKLAYGYSFQLTENFKSEVYDVKMDYFLSEDGLLERGQDE